MTQTIQQIAESLDFGLNFQQVEAENFEDFASNAELGQKWWNQDEELMYYKVQNENDEILIFYHIDGKAYQAC